MSKNAHTQLLIALLCCLASNSFADPSFFAFSPPKNDTANSAATATPPKDVKKDASFFSFDQKSDPAPAKSNEPAKANPPAPPEPEPQTILINFNDVSIIEFLRFISKVSNRNFIFDEKDLQFNVTIVSEEPTTIDNVLTALYQELRIHSLELIEQGNNMIIHKNPRVNSISRVSSDTLPGSVKQKDTEIVTKVFRLNTLEPEKAATIVRPLTSQQSIIEPVVNPNTLIVTDLVTNIEQISQLLKSLDSPNSGLVIGQYAVTNMTVPNLQKLTQEIMTPIAQGQTLILVPHNSAKSIFVIGPPYLVERSLVMMKYIDQQEATTRIHNLEELEIQQPNEAEWKLNETGNWVFNPAGTDLNKSTLINEEGIDRLLERLALQGELEREVAPNEKYILDQLKKKHAILTRELTSNEALLMEKMEQQLKTGKIERNLTNDEKDLLNKLYAEMNKEELPRELTKEEALMLKKLEEQYAQKEKLNEELMRSLTKDEQEVFKSLQKKQKDVSLIKDLSQDETLLVKNLQENENVSLSRELITDEAALLKKLEAKYSFKELNRILTKEEAFFAGLFSQKQKNLSLEKLSPPKGQWYIDDKGKWHFAPEGTPITGMLSPKALGKESAPEGMWEQGVDGRWGFKLGHGGKITAMDLSPKSEINTEIPVGSVETTRFLIHKLQNRQGDEVVYALESVAYSLQSCGNINPDLICTINSAQWIESSNSIIFTGTTTSLERVKELVNEIDSPSRQVFIEMLILETTINDSLTYGVNWATRFGGGETTGSQAFLTAGSPLAKAMDTTGSNAIPTANNLARQSGFSQGVIGQSLSKDGVLYASIGALVTAIHSRTDARIVMNPKLLVEDNQEAEIFVGINTSFKTQSIANDQGQLLTNNFEFRDVGTTLRITPLIGNNDVITLDIYQESSSILASGGNGNTAATENIGPTTRLNKTITRVHIPDGYFLVISGMMQDENTVTRAQVPCLGGVPVLGGLFADRDHTDAKVNLMIFIRPKIVDTIDEIQHLTKHQQDVMKIQDFMKTSWKYGVEEALDFLNIPELCKPCCIQDYVPEE